MNIEEALKTAYNNLPEGVKSKAAKIYGKDPKYFGRICLGLIKDKAIKHRALSAVKQAAKNFKTDTDNKVISVLSVEVNEPKEVKKLK